jgi:hypothetical protein
MGVDGFILSYGRANGNRVSVLYVPSVSYIYRVSGWRIILLATCLLAAFAELISSTLKMEAICSSETAVETQRTTRRHIPEDNAFNIHRCENLKSYLIRFDQHLLTAAAVSLTPLFPIRP